MKAGRQNWNEYVLSCLLPNQLSNTRGSPIRGDTHTATTISRMNVRAIWPLTLRQLPPRAVFWAALAVLVLVSALANHRPDAQWQPFGDQSSHIMATMSLWHDHDLRYTLEDLDRFNARFPAAGGPRGSFLKLNAQGDLFFAKPPLYALLAAPFYGLIGTAGLVVLNLLALAIMVRLTLRCIGTSYGTHLPHLMTAALFLLGPFIAWSMVAHPDLLIALLLYAGGYLLLTRSDGGTRAMAGVLLGLAVSEKPTFALLLPFLLLAARHSRTTTTLVALAAGLAVGWLLPAMLQLSQDGQFLSYQGLRFGQADPPFPLEEGWVAPAPNAFGHVFDMVALSSTLARNLHLVPEKLFDLFWGRQTGLLPYSPVAVALMVGVLVRRQWAGLWLLAGFLSHYLLQTLAFPTNGFGGGQSYGSRYLMQALPLLPLALLAGRANNQLEATMVERAHPWLGAAAVVLTLLLQHATLPPSPAAVADPSRALFRPPLAWFPLEPSLLPSLPVSDRQFTQRSPAGTASVFLTSGFEQGLQLMGPKGASGRFVVHQHDANQALPMVMLFASARTHAQVHKGALLLWEGWVTPGAPQPLPITSDMLQGHAYDLFSQRSIRWDSFSVKWGAATGSEQERFGSVGFETPPLTGSPRMDQFITPAMFSSQGIANRFHWGEVEPWGQWTQGVYAELLIPLPPGASPPLDITLQAHALVTLAHPLQSVEVSVNGRPAQIWEFRQTNAQTLRLRVEQFPGGQVVLGFRVRRPASPTELALGKDPRALGLGLQGLTLSAGAANTR